MRVLVQIPAKDEEENISSVIKSIPRQIKGVETVHVLVIDDGSADNTVEVAFESGADFVLTRTAHSGLANSFSLGTQFFLSMGYDILVNTDGDDQYNQDRIGDLVAPLIRGDSELAVGDRETNKLEHFSRGKRFMQRFGSWVISLVAGAKIPDAASGFRAYSRDLVSRLNVTTKFSYAMETLIQAGNSDARIISIPTGAKPVSRPSRLFRSNSEHVRKSSIAILRALVSYRPVATFFGLATVLAILGLIPFVRFLVLTLTSTPGDHIQSLILGVILLSGAFTSASLAVLSDLVRAQRLLIERDIAIQRLTLKPDSLQDVMDYWGAKLIKR